MLFDPRKDQWWNAPSEQKFQAYYMTLRVHYEMPAAEAFAYAKESFSKYPQFFGDPMRTLREAIRDV